MERKEALKKATGNGTGQEAERHKEQSPLLQHKKREGCVLDDTSLKAGDV